MAFSDAATRQREREAHTLKQFLTYCLVGSLGLHGVALLFKINPKSPLNEPEEITIIVSEAIEPEVEPEPDSAILEEPIIENELPLSDVSEPVTNEPLSTAMIAEPVTPLPPSASIAPLPEPVAEERPPAAPVPDEQPVDIPTTDVPTAPDNPPEAPTVASPEPSTSTPRRQSTGLLEALRRNRLRSTLERSTGSSRDTAAEPRQESSTTPNPGIIAPSSPEANGENPGSGAASCRNCPEVDYPENALRAGAEGRVRVVAETDAQGRVVSVILMESSGNPDLDQAVLEQVRREYEFDGAGAGTTIPIEIDMTIEGSDYNREVTERGERTEVELPATATEPSETPESAAVEPIDPSPSADPAPVEPLSTPEPEPEPTREPASESEPASPPTTTRQPEIIDSFPVPSELDPSLLAPEEPQPAPSVAPSFTELELAPEVTDFLPDSDSAPIAIPEETEAEVNPPDAESVEPAPL